MVIELSQGQVLEVTSLSTMLSQVKVKYQDETIAQAICYHQFLDSLSPGCQVICNRTATKLSLGTGGLDFVVANLDSPSYQKESTGHIMKLRYTPMQFAVESIEEDTSPYHQLFNDKNSLEGMPVVIGSLHSMVIPAVVGAQLDELNSNSNKNNNNNYKKKIAYIMSDGGCLPLDFSKTVGMLKERELLAATITFGHAFGGDYETVNIYTALLTAKYCVKADVAVVAMGPGIVGTGTTWGHTGLEQGTIANAVLALQGRPIVVPRITFNDKRQRHYGLSHHTLTVLQRICPQPVTVVLPILEGEQKQAVQKQLTLADLKKLHNFIEIDGREALEAIGKLQLPLSTMGRGAEQESPFFAAAGGSGVLASRWVNEFNGSYS